MKCRICDHPDVRFIQTYRPYTDYSADIFECPSCGCRFAPHDPDAHEMLHAHATTYAAHDRQAQTAEHLFDRSNSRKLYRFLSKSNKNRFVMDFIRAQSNIRNVAEVGCSLGYLTSFFIADSYEAYGFDISESAVSAAKHRFGDHFFRMKLNRSFFSYRRLRFFFRVRDHFFLCYSGVE